MLWLSLGYANLCQCLNKDFIDPSERGWMVSHLRGGPGVSEGLLPQNDHQPEVRWYWWQKIPVII